MHDIRLIRDNPDAFDAGLKRRGLAPLATELLALDEARRSAQTRLQDAQSRRNEASKEIGTAKREGRNADDLMAEVAALKDQMAILEQEEAALALRLNTILQELPNIPAADVPDGVDETGNVLFCQHGTPRNYENVRDHVALGEGLGLMDFTRAAKLSGSRFVVLSGGLARMERALGQFMLDNHRREFGYLEMSPPLMVRDAAMFGTGNLPKFGDDAFRTNTDHWLIPTAEVSLTNLVADEILDAEQLPIRFTAMTPCFRSEAGSAGRDTRGMIRQHQFYKVELVSITAPEQSNDEHTRMLGAAESILKKLDLPYRIMTLCTGDMGFGAKKTFDIEVWLPGQGAYREISSCSNCGDFQARRMNSRFRKQGDKSTQFVHTLNGSGLAIGRTMVAVLENYQNPDGSISIPTVLQPYMDGLARLEVA
jgi:seryl-tRNA synthetase